METQILESFSQCRIPELNSPQTCSRLPPLTADIRCKNSLFPLPLPAPYRICRACVVRAVRVSVASHGPCVVDGCPTGRRRDLSPWLPATSDRLGPCPPLVRLGPPPSPCCVYLSHTFFFPLPGRPGNPLSTPPPSHSSVYRPDPLCQLASQCFFAERLDLAEAASLRWPLPLQK